MFLILNFIISLIEKLKEHWENKESYIHMMHSFHKVVINISCKFRIYFVTNQVQAFILLVYYEMPENTSEHFKNQTQKVFNNNSQIKISPSKFLSRDL